MGAALRSRLAEAVARACRAETGGDAPTVSLEKPRQAGHGDLATGVAMAAAKALGERPGDLARRVAARLSEDAAARGLIERVEVAGAGFINLFLAAGGLREEVARCLREGVDYGRLAPARPERILIEFVSANPTGPLTVAHGRQAAVGDSLARILAHAGHRVSTEYYLNDAGRQIRLLGLSALARYREALGREGGIPEGGYLGGYVGEIAEEIRRREGDRWLGAPADAAAAFFAEHAAGRIGEGIRRDLEEFRVRFDRWTSEREFAAGGAVEECLRELRDGGFVYEKDGAVWFGSEALGDDKDRVLVKRDGETTYFAPDIAYHRDKFRRGFDRLIDLWGPDHHGYVARMRAAVKALGREERSFTPVIVQLTTLFRGKERLRMSTRAGEFITLRQVMDEVGVDAARYFFARMRTGSHLHFDLELARRRSNDNPVYYVQYVHARVCSIFARLPEKAPGFTLPPTDGIPLDRLGEREELDLMKRIADFPTAVERSAEALEPNGICNHLEELATAFHQCYTRHTVISDDPGLTAARLALADAVRTVVRNGLGLLGVSAPARM
ncbi:MAG: arginine--tRNA ligase [bacterium]|nr:arginine--tRNA ligase [bacterium]